MVLCSDYKYSKPIEHYAIFTAYFYLSFRFIHCFVAGRSTGNSMLRLKILFGFPRYSDCRWRFIDRRRSLHLGIRAAALALPCVSCRIIAARGRRSNRPHIGSAGICGCRCRSCRMELPDHRLRSALRKSWPNSPPVPLAAAGSRLPDRATARE